MFSFSSHLPHSFIIFSFRFVSCARFHAFLLVSRVILKIFPFPLRFSRRSPLPGDPLLAVSIEKNLFPYVSYFFFFHFFFRLFVCLFVCIFFALDLFAFQRYFPVPFPLSFVSLFLFFFFLSVRMGSRFSLIFFHAFLFLLFTVPGSSRVAARPFVPYSPVPRGSRKIIPEIRENKREKGETQREEKGA